jgi:KDO2-lipid IV(A) lauroyltransferase
MTSASLDLRHRFSASAAIDTRSQRADALALTALFSSELERAIREAPEQWVWMHQRWKTRPA